jgi:DNA replication and repair protein RecF
MDLSESRNLITGPNGAGKTSILEAIYLLGSGHSFKSASLDALIQGSAADFLVVGKFNDEQRSTIGVRCGLVERDFRLSGEPVKKLTDLASRFPVQVIDPEVHQLLEAGPGRRRRFLDWGVFHVEPAFRDSWRRFTRAIKQRNAALKTSRSTPFNIWDADVVTHGGLLTEQRLRYLTSLEPYIDEIGKKLLGESVRLEYLQGWRKNLSLAEALNESRTRDRERGVTSVGPHRADLNITVGGCDAKDRVSRGQQKMLACVLMLAQQFHRASLSAGKACLLLDDPAAELDVINLRRLLDVIAELPIQLIATSLSASNLSLFDSAKKFHVERGSVKAMA